MLRFLKKRKRLRSEIHPDEILIDSSNVSDFDTDQFEGRIEQPISRRSFVLVGVLLTGIFFAMVARASVLQVWKGEAYAKQAIENQLEKKTVFSDRGMLVDRTGRPLAWNERESVEDDFAKRLYAAFDGLGHVVGYVKAPAKDSKGTYFRKDFVGLDGAEKAFDTRLKGENGLKLTETDARNKVISESTVQPPVAGEKIVLSIDAAVTEGLYKAISRYAIDSKFKGAAGVIMDIETGEIIAMTSYPEFSPTAMETGDSVRIKQYFADKRQPFLNRVTDGLYAPGSIVKPIMAAAALTEKIITPEKQILSTGSISVPNPYDPKKPSVYKDWKAHGWVDMRHAIAVSSDVYFYAIGGGYKDQTGLGIDRMETYYRMFGFGSDAGLVGFSEKTGTIPNPVWKEQNFPGDPWRIGNSYHTAIGQYGLQVTPLQAVRAIAAIANNGKLVTPSMLASTTPHSVSIPMTTAVLQVAREGMRLSVTEGIAQAVKFDYVRVAAKTGTAQIGVNNEFINSWMVGFFPYEHPRYAYAIVLERGPAHTLVGASAAMGSFISWMHEHAPQYLE